MNETETPIYDIAIIGGGINGCGIARDAAGRGLKVFLAEQGDLAQGTSSASTKLIHGGLRYLEHYEFSLVRESLTEREVLWKMAPHIIRPLRFILPHHNALRPAWLLRLGLFVYDHIGGRKKLPATKTIDLTNDRAGTPLVNEFRKGFEYSDCWVDDARLVVLNAIDAKQRGADIYTRTQCITARRENNTWQVTLRDVETDRTSTIKARSLVNAAGPWVDELLDKTELKPIEQTNVRLVRGSHIIVPKIYQHDRAYIFQNADNRIIFAIPYEQNFTLLGTTDADHGDNLDQVKISEDEIQYICDAASVYFKHPINPDRVVWTYSGVRPLYDDGASTAQEATRDYVLNIEDKHDKAPLLNIFGGKITTYRHLAEDALQKLSPYLNSHETEWTADSQLPGGDFEIDEFEAMTRKLQDDYPFVEQEWATSLIRRYGTRAWKMLGGAKTLEDLGQNFGATLTKAEALFLICDEWAKSAEDILWRRSKIGLHMTQQQRDEFTHWFDERMAGK
uniref:Glycerol-3-phosphate dehydrogenase n=1 Tax=uncultured Thiotrichaceae bacterium TaxID=298394 RepID=A0A6S6UG07_9GAMM|nr:MAG: Aerobic glycerol-3-phosphate dehydrogenase (EC [uncultured Thiotrichaceae bacterium]